MCGIAGVFNRVTGAPISPDHLAAMAAMLRHRGPDDHGLFRRGPLGLAQTLLRIMDRDAGGQPLSDPRTGVTLVYNGEIWDYRSLRERLRRQGHTFREQGDTEVVLRAYLEYGPSFLRQLDGMFALAIWDPRTSRLLLARDPLGKKPLYFALPGAGDLVFASEIKALFCDPRLAARPHLDGLADYLVLGYIPAPDTAFAGIHKVPPATYLLADAGSVRPERYWRLGADREEAPTGPAELGARVRTTLRAAVERRLGADAPVGALLSGGLDSSVMVAEASRLLGRPLPTFAVAFADAPARYDERRYARYVAARYGTLHQETLVGPREYAAELPAVTWHHDDPPADVPHIPAALVCRDAARSVKVLLSGEGGDEVFGGYSRHIFDSLASYLGVLPAAARPGLRALLIRALARRPRLTHYAALLEPDFARRFVAWSATFAEDELVGVLAAQPFACGRSRGASRAFAQRLFERGTSYAAPPMLDLDLSIWLPEQLLMRGDRASMAASIEMRMPYLDRALIGLVAALPRRQLVDGFVGKRLLKDAYAHQFPRPFLHRKKVGFWVPFGRWLRGPDFAFLRLLLAGERAASRGLLRPHVARTLLAEHVAGQADHSRKLFALLCLELWHRVHLDHAFSRPPTWDALLDPPELAAWERAHSC